VSLFSSSTNRFTLMAPRNALELVMPGGAAYHGGVQTVSILSREKDMPHAQRYHHPTARSIGNSPRCADRGDRSWRAQTHRAGNRGGVGEDKISFTPSILPRYLRKAKSAEELPQWLCLKGVSMGDFTEALAALLGPNARGLSATTITR